VRPPGDLPGWLDLDVSSTLHAGEDADEAEVVVGIETGRGPWVAALIAAGYQVFPVSPLQASRYRERHGVSRAKSDSGDAHMLAGMVRTDSHQLRPAAGDSPEAEAVKVLARTHKTLTWERTRAVQRLRHQLLGYFPAALEAFEDLDAPARWNCSRRSACAGSWPRPTSPESPDGAKLTGYGTSRAGVCRR
jgi:transposase